MSYPHHIFLAFISLLLFNGCVSTAPTLHTKPTPQKYDASLYGKKPRNYVASIKNYFSHKLIRASKAQYHFTTPIKAYKKEAYTYGGDISWRGWLVHTSIATPTRTGRMLTPKPYMVLFSNEQIIEDIVGKNHYLITEVGR